VERSLRLGGALGWFWTLHGYLTEGRAWLARALAQPDASPEPLTGARAKALDSAWELARRQGDHSAARALGQEHLALSTAAGDAHGIVRALGGLALLAREQGDYAAARAQYEDLLALARP